MLNNREIKMLDIFSSGEEVSIKKLKEKFDISERMVRYDIDKINFVLSIFNIKPIYRNKSGTFKLDSNNKINKIKVMVKEAEPIDIEKRKNLYNIFTDSPLTKKCSQQLEEYFNGKRKEFNIKLDIRGTEFQKQCWETLLEVPYGKTISYSDEAKMIGNDKAVRAVGSANGKNCIPIIIPCHRIISKDGKLGGYSGGEGGNKGIEIKKYLLELEKNFK